MHLVMPVTFRARPNRDLRVEGSRVVVCCNPYLGIYIQFSDTNSSQAPGRRDVLTHGLSAPVSVRLSCA